MDYFTLAVDLARVAFRSSIVPLPESVIAGTGLEGLPGKPELRNQMDPLPATSEHIDSGNSSSSTPEGGARPGAV